MLEQLEQVENAVESEDKIRRAYRRQMTGEFGQLMLIDMLYELHFLRPCENEAEQALCNYAKKLISTIYGVEVRQARLLALISKMKKEEPEQSKHKEIQKMSDDKLISVLNKGECDTSKTRFYFDSKKAFKTFKNAIRKLLRKEK